MARRGVDLLLFAGGDGTARDVYTAVGERLPTLGIPPGVKIHSAVYAANPDSAGDLAGAFLAGRVSRLREAEVMAIAERVGVGKTLVGVDVFAVESLVVVAAAVNESQLLALLEEGRRARIVVTPIGGQGYIFGRGNQQISPRVIRRVGAEHILVVSTVDKIHALGGRPLLVDTGDRSLDEDLVERLRGYVKVITGYHEQIVYRVAC